MKMEICVNERGYYLMMVIMVAVGMTTASYDSAGATHEYCERESFTATCGPDHVIWIKSALYGRMAQGRCVRTDYGSLGCKEDVRDLVQGICAGRRQCEFPISDLHSTGPCPPELLSYLAASYECIPVSTCTPSLCKTGSYLKVPMSQHSGFIGGITTSETGCGSPLCPWMLEPQEGQRVNLTFYAFQDRDRQNDCHRHAAVLDKSTQVSKDVTAGCNGAPMVTSIMTTESAAAEIKVYSGSEDAASRIIIAYKMVGCPSIKPPEGAKMTRKGDLLTVECETTSRSWHLTCNENAWVGEIGMCEDPGKSAAWMTEGAGTSAQGLALVVGIGIALGVLLGFTLLGLAVFCMRRHRRNHYQRPNDVLRYPPKNLRKVTR